MPRACIKCGKESTFSCVRCYDVVYCSEQCQVDDWPKHKKACSLRCWVLVGEDPRPNVCYRKYVCVSSETLQPPCTDQKLSKLYDQLQLSSTSQLYAFGTAFNRAKPIGAGTDVWHFLAEARIQDLKIFAMPSAVAPPPSAVPADVVARYINWVDLDFGAVVNGGVTTERAAALYRECNHVHCVTLSWKTTRSVPCYFSKNPSVEASHRLLLHAYPPKQISRWQVLDFTCDVTPQWRPFTHYACAFAEHCNLPTDCTALSLTWEHGHEYISIFDLLPPKSRPSVVAMERVYNVSNCTMVEWCDKTYDPDLDWRNTAPDEWTATAKGIMCDMWAAMNREHQNEESPCYKVLKLCIGQMMRALPCNESMMYLENVGAYEIINDIAQEICQTRPDDVLRHLIKYLDIRIANRNRVTTKPPPINCEQIYSPEKHPAIASILYQNPAIRDSAKAASPRQVVYGFRLNSGDVVHIALRCIASGP